MSSSQEEGEVSNDDSEFSVDLKTNKIKKRTKKKKSKKTPKIVSSTYKKQKCLHFNKGNCTKGQTCTFSHDFQPQSSKIICKYFLSNSCTKGQQCNFSHNTQNYPCRFFHFQNRCNQRSECRFSHLPIEKQVMSEFLKENKDLILNLSKQQKLGLICDQSLRRETIAFALKESPHEQPKKKGFKGELKLLAQNIIQMSQPSKPKLMDPRLKLKASRPLKLQQSGRAVPDQCNRSWISEVMERHSQTIYQHRKIDKGLLERFLYSYY